MLSMPPATTIFELPARMASWASMAAFMPEPQTLFTVVQGTRCGNPAPIAACRAGAWPTPAGSTQPMNTSSGASELSPARATAADIATPPSSGAATLLNWPCREPMGVRAAPAMTTISGGIAVSFEQLAADQHAANFGCARSDFIELGIAQQAAGGHLIDVTHAAKRLDGLQRHLGCVFGGEQDYARGIFALDRAGVAGAGCCIDIGTRRIQSRVHIRELTLHQFERADRLAELLALAHVRQHEIECSLHDAERTGGEHNALIIQTRHQNGHALIHAAEHAIFRHFAILQDELAGIGAAHAELVELLRGRKSFETSLDQESGDVAAFLRIAGLGIDDQKIGDGPIRDPHLVAVEDEAAAFLFGARAHGQDVGARSRFAHGERADPLAG